jgi:hypothetical protein
VVSIVSRNLLVPCLKTIRFIRSIEIVVSETKTVVLSNGNAAKKDIVDKNNKEDNDTVDVDKQDSATKKDADSVLPTITRLLLPCVWDSIIVDSS